MRQEALLWLCCTLKVGSRSFAGDTLMVDTKSREEVHLSKGHTYTFPQVSSEKSEREGVAEATHGKLVVAYR